MVRDEERETQIGFEANLGLLRTRGLVPLLTTRFEEESSYLSIRSNQLSLSGRRIVRCFLIPVYSPSLIRPLTRRDKQPVDFSISFSIDPSYTSPTYTLYTVIEIKSPVYH